MRFFVITDHFTQDSKGADTQHMDSAEPGYLCSVKLDLVLLILTFGTISSTE